MENENNSLGRRQLIGGFGALALAAAARSVVAAAPAAAAPPARSAGAFGAFATDIRSVRDRFTRNWAGRLASTGARMYCGGRFARS